MLVSDIFPNEEAETTDGVYFILFDTFFFALCLTPGARLPVLGPFHMGMVPSVPTLDVALLVVLGRLFGCEHSR